MAMTGATTGKVGRYRAAEPAYFNQRVAKLSARGGREYDDYVYALVTQPGFANKVLNNASGSAQPNVSAEGIGRIEVPYLAPREQLAVGRITGILDDKIELTRKMTATFEAMARALFVSWFVNFDPVRAKTERWETGLSREIAASFPDSLVNSDLGETPKGWRIGTLNDLISQRVERCIESEETIARPYVPIDCISSKSLLLSTARPGSEAKSSLTKFRKGDILFGAMRPYFHKVCVAPFDGTTRTTVFVLMPKDGFDFAFLTLLMHDSRSIDYATAHSTGTTIPYAVWSDSLERMPVVVPSTEARRQFDGIVRPMLERISKAFFEQVTLSSLRDTLLTKLISGELHMTDAERTMEKLV
jgi:type I restriction enzyme S subunit